MLRLPGATRGFARVAGATTVAASLLATGVAAGATPARAELIVVRGDIVSAAPYPGSSRTVPVVLHLVNRGGPLEVEVRRDAGATTWRASQVVGGERLPMPEGVPLGPKGLGRAIGVTVLDAARRVVRREALDLCLNAQAVRLGPSGAALSPFPQSCLSHPFARGLRLGLATDYAVPVDLSRAVTAGLRPGRYTVRVRVRPATAEWLGMARGGRAVTLGLRVRPLPPRQRGSTDGVEVEVPASGPVVEGHPEHRPPYRRPPATPIPPTDVVPPADALPNLAALPAYEIVAIGRDGRDALHFSSTVWNAGPGPLIVEGYRRGAAPIMDASQFFRRADEDVAAVPVGILDYDAREEHDHWHFRDFARYSLATPGGRIVAASPKEAWCLAPTDQIDQLVPNAELRPGDPFLSTACGDASAVQVRQVLEVGAGDTYGIGTPGQTVDITRLPNGPYDLRIEANPARALRETTVADNVALRRVVLGGTRGRRTVRVPPVEGIDTERRNRAAAGSLSVMLPLTRDSAHTQARSVRRDPQDAP